MKADPNSIRSERVQLKTRLLSIGATIRLQELNREREILLKLIGESNGHTDANRETRAAILAEASSRKHANGKTLKGKLNAQRARTLKALAKFSTTTPRVLTIPGLGSLVRRGYLVAKDEGYIRTNKPYALKIGRGKV